MIRRISVRLQRIPMVDARTLEGRTRPSDALPVAPVRFRLTYAGWTAWAQDEAALRAWKRERSVHHAPR